MKAETSAKVEAIELNTHFAAAARQRIDQFLKSFVSFEPSLVLLYGDLSPKGDNGSWSISAYGSQTVADMATMYSGFGGKIYYEIDGIPVLIPQIRRVNELDSVELDFVADRLRPTPSSQA